MPEGEIGSASRASTPAPEDKREIGVVLPAGGPIARVKDLFEGSGRTSYALGGLGTQRGLSRTMGVK